MDNCSGAVIAPMFLDATRDVARGMEKAGLPYIILNTSIDGVGGHLAYYGQPIYDSGAFCADVLMVSEWIWNIIMTRKMKKS